MVENIGNTSGCKFFRASELLEVFSAEFLDEARCTEWILKRMHPEGAFCPACKNKIEDETTLNNFWWLRRCKCKHCNKWFSAYSGTFLYNSHLTPQQAVLLAVQIAQGNPRKVIAKMLGIHPDTVRLWQKRFGMYE